MRKFQSDMLKVEPSFLPPLGVKHERGELHWETIFKKKEIQFDNTGNSQPMQITKTQKLGGSLSRKPDLKRKPRVWLDYFLH